MVPRIGRVPCHVVRVVAAGVLESVAFLSAPRGILPLGLGGQPVAIGRPVTLGRPALAAVAQSQPFFLAQPVAVGSAARVGWACIMVAVGAITVRVRGAQALKTVAEAVTPASLINSRRDNWRCCGMCDFLRCMLLSSVFDHQLPLGPDVPAIFFFAVSWRQGDWGRQTGPQSWALLFVSRFWSPPSAFICACGPGAGMT